jgi:primosomal protein N' (replication factor Y)
MNLVDVAVTLPLQETLTYRDPRGERAPLGTQVIVPLGSRMVTGFVVGYREEAPGRVRDIEAFVGDEPVLDESILALCRFAAEYYLAPLGEVLRAALPYGERAVAARRVRLTEPGQRLAREGASGAWGLGLLAFDAADRAFLDRLSKSRSLSVRSLCRSDPNAAARLQDLEKQGLIAIGDEVRVASRRKAGATHATAMGFDDGAPALPALAAAPTLNAHQADALGALVAGLDQGYATFVLHGVTGSGKTEVYMQLVAEARRRGRGALVLVPEIALTPQLAARFRARFSEDVVVLHSALSPATRRAAWHRLRRGEVGIALGARSAVFAPVRALGVVVVDEEHDGSFKQEEGVRYHGRDLAVVRAEQAGAVAVLGSATPSLETYHNAMRGRFRKLCLPVRANPAAAGRPLPPVEIIDLRVHPPGPDGLLSPPLAQAIRETLAAGEQAILFLNRRGFSTLIVCRGCGAVIQCRHCAVSMTYHRGRDRLLCHYCARSEPLPARCPGCQQAALQGLGTGTERVESVIRECFPGARVARLDRDTVETAHGVHGVGGILAQVHAREIDILVGTQMVTKGHDFEHVTLVGVLQPDQGLHLPEFRAAERTFQLLEQVAGRAGRAHRPGRALVQTYSVDHPAIEALRTHDYDGFVRGELERRRDAQYPPLVRMMAVRLDGTHVNEVRAAAIEAAARAQADGGAQVRVLGPAEAPIARVRGRARWQVWLLSQHRAAMVRAARAAMATPVPRTVRLAVDVDPQSVL